MWQHNKDGQDNYNNNNKPKDSNVDFQLKSITMASKEIDNIGTIQTISVTEIKEMVQKYYQDMIKVVEDYLRNFKKQMSIYNIYFLNTLSAIIAVILAINNVLGSKNLSVFILSAVLISWLTMFSTTFGSVKQKLQKITKHRRKIEHLYAIFDSIGVGVISTDNQMTVTFMNSTAEEMCGWCSRLAVGRPIADIMKTSENNELVVYESPWEESTLKGNKIATMATRKGDGQKVDLELSTSVLRKSGRLSGTVTLLRDVTDSRALFNKMSFMATHDALTGMPNRASFEARLEEAINNSDSDLPEHVVVYLDLDGFKRVNDIAGHAAGDALLKEISQLMRIQLRATDFLARIGGDEFALILYDCGLREGKILMEHLVRQICEYPFSWEGVKLHVGASAGITLLRRCSGGAGTLLREADEGLYTAKLNGKGQVCVYNDSRKQMSHNNCLLNAESKELS